MAGPEPSDAEVLRAQLDRAILNDEPAFDAVEVSRQAGVTVEESLRMWRALGFPDAGQESVFTASDITALRHIRQARENGLDEDSLVRMTRALGTTMSRLADWEISNLIGAFEESHLVGSTLEQRLEGAIELVEKVTPWFDELVLYAWRRHLVAAVARTEALVPASDAETEVVTTVGFADLVGFTSTTNALDEDALGDLVELFESRSADAVSARHGRVIKSLGDSVLFVAENADDAARIAFDIITVIGGDTRLPDVHVGLATGPCVFRLGDVYGPAVNLAARLTTVARRNRVIVDAATSESLSVDQFESRTLPARPIRGFGDVEPVAIRRL